MKVLRKVLFVLNYSTGYRAQNGGADNTTNILNLSKLKYQLTSRRGGCIALHFFSRDKYVQNNKLKVML